MFIGFSLFKSFLPVETERVSHGMAGTIAAVLTTLIFLKWDNRPFTELNLIPDTKTIWKFFAGVLTGIVMMGSLGLVSVYYSNLHVTVNPGGTVISFLIVTSPIILLALMEELAFRAYPLKLLVQAMGTRRGIFICALLFALYHLVNGWPVSTSLLGPGVWGIVFGLAAVYSNGIALPTGIHYAANLTTSAFSDTPAALFTVEKTATVSSETVMYITSAILLAAALLLLECFIRNKKPI